MASVAILGALALGTWGFISAPTNAGGETRTISLVHQHTKERLTVTYMVNGRYVPSAMKKLNYFLRDWRRNEVIAIDPRTIDLVWELHADLGSKQPIHVISGYRSPKTNAFLKRIGRKVAKRSQHMRGKAIDFFFPDVPTAKIRNVALAHRLGGVGYYRAAGGPTGFIHADSGNVRHWGPGMKGSQVASYIRDGKKVIGRRHGKKLWSSSQVASVNAEEEKKSGGLLGLLIGSKKKKAEVQAAAEPLESAYVGTGDAIAGLAADAAAQSMAEQIKTLRPQVPTPLAEPYGLEVEDEEDAEEIASGELAALSSSVSVAPETAAPKLASGTASHGGATRKVPRPQLKPAQVMQLAAAREAEQQFRIVPANAPPESQMPRRKPSQVADPLGLLIEAQSAGASPSTVNAATGLVPTGMANLDGKSDLEEGLRDKTHEDDIIIRPVVAALSAAESSLWSLLSPDVEDDLRRDGLPDDFDDMKEDIMPVAVELGPDGTGPATSLDVQSEASGKGDSEEINREGKGNLLAPGIKLTYRAHLDEGVTP